MARRRREIETAGLSFLDCICCGFGAVILLLVITKIHQPRAIVEIQEALAARLSELAEEFTQLRVNTTQAEGAVAAAELQVEREERSLAALRAQLARLRGELDESEQEAKVSARIADQLQSARQELSEEMKRLQLRPSDSVVGGIPVDSEYIVFIIDTSGSMRRFNWQRVVAKVEETLAVYPDVRGIQVMNDMGTYMFSGYAGRWIPDSPARRRSIMARLRNWDAFSNSSPVEGITNAIRAFYSTDKRVSLYVFGDEFAGSSVQSVVDDVERINRRGSGGDRRVRIHGLGFPIPAGQAQETSRRFAMLMRELCQRNGGTFVALAR
jgi:hypothetical protein